MNFLSDIHSIYDIEKTGLLVEIENEIDKFEVSSYLYAMVEELKIDSFENKYLEYYLPITYRIITIILQLHHDPNISNKFYNDKKYVSEFINVFDIYNLKKYLDEKLQYINALEMLTNLDFEAEFLRLVVADYMLFLISKINH